MRIDEKIEGGEGYVYIKQPEWVDAGNGFKARAYNTHSGPRMEVMAPNGVIVSKGLGGASDGGPISTSVEGTLDQILSGEVEDVFKDFGKKTQEKPTGQFSRIETPEQKSAVQTFESLPKFTEYNYLSDAQKAEIDSHPDAERIRYVQDNFLDLLAELETRPKEEFEIQC